MRTRARKEDGGGSRAELYTGGRMCGGVDGAEGWASGSREEDSEGRRVDGI